MTDYTYTDSFAPDSTLVKKAFYHRGDQNLFVQLGLSTYRYAKVPSYVWDAFAAAPSAGNHYNTNIKGKYDAQMDVGKLEYIGSQTVKSENVVAGTEIHKFVLVGHSPVEYAVEAKSLEDAKADFARLFPEGTLKEVRIHFA